MDTNWKITSIFLLLIFLSSGCKTDPKKEYEKAVLEWTGKTIIFPDSMRTIFGKPLAPPESEYTIVAYFDSVGCTSCRMKLPEWIEFMKKVATLDPQKNVELIIITDTKDKQQITSLIRQYRFHYNVVNDSLGYFRSVNNLTEDKKLHSFLLDSNHKVVLLGNPTDSKVIADLYLEQISSGLTDNLNSTDNEIIYEHDFGTVRANEEVNQEFVSTNENTDTLKLQDIVSSCEGISAVVSEDNIAPKDSFTVKILFKDTVKGDFTRSVTLRFQENKPERIFEISGTIIN